MVEEETCGVCDKGFEQDEWCIELDGLIYHDDCFREAAADILLERYGAEERRFHIWDEWDEADLRREDYF